MHDHQPNSDLVFINATDLQGVKPKDAKRRKLIRQQAMRDVGKARRSERPKTGPHIIQLEVLSPRSKLLTPPLHTAYHAEAQEEPRNPPDWKLYVVERSSLEAWRDGLEEMLAAPARSLLTNSDCLIDQSKWGFKEPRK